MNPCSFSDTLGCCVGPCVLFNFVLNYKIEIFVFYISTSSSNQMIKKLFYTLVFVLNNLVSNGQGSYDEKLKTLYSGTVTTISPERLSELIKEDSILILDTREKNEYDVSHINGAVFMSYDQFKKEGLQLDLSGVKQVVVYCSVGYRSEQVGEEIKKNKAIQVFNLYGGIFQWVNQGHVVVNRSGPTNKVHTYNKTWSKWLIKGEKIYE